MRTPRTEGRVAYVCPARKFSRGNARR